MSLGDAKSVSLRTALWMAAGSAAFVSAFFAGVFVARATPGPGGGTSKPLLFAGTLRQNGQPMTGPQDLAFTFRKGSTTCDVAAKGVMVDESGGFAAPIPLDDQAGTCTSAFFDGSDVTFDVSVQGATFSGDVSPVPYAKYAEQAGTPDCPAGYSRDPAVAKKIICLRKVGDAIVDEIVRVGVGRSAFWIDRYEATVWSSPDDTGNVPWGKSDGDYPSSFLRNGQWTTDDPPALALSKPAVPPSAFITWFQANTACRASGKRLPAGDEWLEAARGTVDPGGNDGLSNDKCNTNSSSSNLRFTGLGGGCESQWGAQDMIGNLWELTSEWYAGLKDTGGSSIARPWTDPLYNQDMTHNITSWSQQGSTGVFEEGIPAATLRGGYFNDGPSAGLFALLLNPAPSGWYGGLGFRCIIPR